MPSIFGDRVFLVRGTRPLKKKSTFGLRGSILNIDTLDFDNPESELYQSDDERVKS